MPAWLAGYTTQCKVSGCYHVSRQHAAWQPTALIYCGTDALVHPVHSVLPGGCLAVKVCRELWVMEPPALTFLSPCTPPAPAAIWMVDQELELFISLIDHLEAAMRDDPAMAHGTPRFLTAPDSFMG